MKKHKILFKRTEPLVIVKVRKQEMIDNKTTSMPTIYNGLPADVLKKVLAYISINLTAREACLKAGISYNYFSELKNRNVDNINDMVEKSKLSSKIHHLQRIHKAEKNWQASAWFLERTSRKTYGREIELESPENVKKQIIKIGNREIEF